MRVNILLTGIYRSGGMKVILKYAGELALKGHDVVLYKQVIPYNYMKGKTSLAVLKLYLIKTIAFFKKKKENLPFPELKVPVKSVLLARDLFIRKAEVTIATEWVTAYSLNSLSDDKGAKVYFIQGYETWKSNTAKVFESYTLKLKRITISNYLKQLLINCHNADSTVIMNGLDFEIFYNEYERKAGDIVNIGFIYSIQKQKNTKSTISIIEKLRQFHPNINILSFGLDKPLLPDYIRYTADPSPEELRRLYSEMDIFIFLSEQEGFALPPAEAMACRCAVITTATGAVTDYSRHMHSAIHIKNVIGMEEIYNHLQYLLLNKDEINRIGNNAYEEVRKVLSWERSVNEMEDFLTRATEEYNAT